MLLDRQAHRGFKEFRVSKVYKVLPEPLVLPVPPVRLGLPVQRALLALQDHRGFKESKVSLGNKAPLELQVQLAQQVLSVLPELQVLLVQ